MRIARLLGPAFAAACAISALAVPGASASPLFLSHPLGLLLASGGGGQRFTIGGGTFECTSLKLLPPGDTTIALRALSLLLVVDYEKCVFFGGLSLTTHPVRYRIDANGLASLENDLVMLGSEGCKITWPAAKNQSLTTVKFDNNTVKNILLLLLGITKITSRGEGGPIGLCEFAEESNTIYEGTIHLKLDGTASIPNTLRWDP
jgi:hypothetical protein